MSSLCPTGLEGQIDRQASWGQKNPHTEVGINSDTICNNPLQLCPLWAKWVPHDFKTRHMVKKKPYLFSARNFLPYSIWDIST